MRNLWRPTLGAILMLAFSLGGAMALQACSTFQQVQQLPLDRRIELQYKVSAQVKLEVAAALDAKTISKSTAESFLKRSEGVRKALDVAREFYPLDVSSAEAQLQVAKEILTKLQADLIAKGEK